MSNYADILDKALQTRQEILMEAKRCVYLEALQGEGSMKVQLDALEKAYHTVMDVIKTIDEDALKTPVYLQSEWLP